MPTTDATQPQAPAPRSIASRTRLRPSAASIAIAVLTAVLLGAFALVVHHASSSENHVALAGAPRPVTVALARGAQYRAMRSYVGTLDSWVEANVGPQFISAYVDTVLVRPGAVVRRGDVLATLDCANANAATRAVAMQAHAVDARQRALADEAAREKSLLDGGFVAPNEVETKSAQTEAERAQLEATEAQLAAASLGVRDCVLRAPFDGEIAARAIDPGAFVHPGASIVSVLDRTTVRVVGEAPETDFDAIAPGTRVRVRVPSTSRVLDAKISRRAPRADARTRTVHFEIDVPDPNRELAVGTTGIVEVDVGQPIPGVEVPLYAANIHEGKAKLFIVDGGVAHARQAPVVGERGGALYLDPNAIRPGTHVVTEGVSLLSDGDRVVERVEEAPPPSGSAGARGGGFGRPL